MSDSGRVVQAFEQSIDVSIATVSLNVVVMGPNQDRESSAARLRKRLIEAARDFGAAVQPEHRGILESSKSRLGAGHHLAALEVHLVSVSDLVVLIPASAGSLCELGLFSSYDKSATKMLVLASEEYPKKGTYVADGPLLQARHNGAHIEHVDYADFDACWALVQARIEQIRAKKGLEKMLRGTQ